MVLPILCTNAARGVAADSLFQQSHLETVSTARGSGWVSLPNSKSIAIFALQPPTHPLPRAVLTVSKRELGLLRQSARGVVRL